MHTRTRTPDKFPRGETARAPPSHLFAFHHRYDRGERVGGSVERGNQNRCARGTAWRDSGGVEEEGVRERFVDDRRVPHERSDERQQHVRRVPPPQLGNGCEIDMLRCVTAVGPSRARAQRARSAHAAHAKQRGTPPRTLVRDLASTRAYHEAGTQPGPKQPGTRDQAACLTVGTARPCDGHATASSMPTTTTWPTPTHGGLGLTTRTTGGWATDGRTRRSVGDAIRTHRVRDALGT